MIGERIHDAWPAAVLDPPARYTCGYCDREAESAAGWTASGGQHRVALCPHCRQPTYLVGRLQVPAPRPGAPLPLRGVEGEVYGQARDAMGLGAYTAVVLLCGSLAAGAARACTRAEAEAALAELAAGRKVRRPPAGGRRRPR